MKKLLVLLVLCLRVVLAAPAEESIIIQCEDISIEAPLGWLVQYTKTPSLLFMSSPLENNDTFQEKVAYVLTFSSNLQNFNRYRDVFESISNTFIIQDR